MENQSARSCALKSAASLCLFLLPILTYAQTTQCVISGRVFDSITGLPLQNAKVRYWLRLRSNQTNADANLSNSAMGQASTDENGFYFLPMLSPGSYRLAVSYAGAYQSGAYQAQEVSELELFVSAALNLNFALRPAVDVWGSASQGKTFSPGEAVRLHYYATDVENLKSIDIELVPGKISSAQSTLSYVVDPEAIDNLPLAGRDAYAALVLLPGVTADTGTVRGLGIAVNGQRRSSSNFLLDGMENNNTLTTGPLTPVAPESIEEYRVSTNSYSAQYGRTSGYIANAITKSGQRGFHGTGYFYLENDVLNANNFQENLKGIPRRPAKQAQGGYQAGGSFPKSRNLFWSSSFEQLRSRSLLDPAPYTFFTPAAQPKLDPVGAELLRLYPGPAVTPSAKDPTIGTVTISPPVAVDRSLALERVDYRVGADQIMARVSLSRISQPDFIWSAYPGFTSGSRDTALSLAIADQHAFSSSLINELRASYGSDRLAWDRAHSELSYLYIATQPNPVLPGSPAFYSYLNDHHTWQVLDNLNWIHGRHLLVVGGSILPSTWSGFQTNERDGVYQFRTSANFESNLPSSLLVAFQRDTFLTPEYSRDYRSTPWNLFAQDTFRVSRRLTLNLGLRYEMFGSPRNTGNIVDTTVQVVAGMNVTQANALLLSNTNRQIYRTDRKDFAPRFGVAWDLSGNGALQFRAGYGIFYERPFDNLWQTVSNNQLQIPAVTSFEIEDQLNYLALRPTQVAAIEASFGNGKLPASSPSLTMFDPNFQSGMVQSYFYGLEYRASQYVSIELNGIGAVGRHLVTTDIINRNLGKPCFCRNTQLSDDVEYHAPQGNSSYQALTVLARYRAPHAQFQIAWTLGHSIDNQSDPMGFDIYNLSASTQGSLAAGATASGPTFASFSRQFDNRADRGNSDFDQRQNLVFYGLWDLPTPSGTRLLRGVLSRWEFAQLAAFRSGFPFSVFANSLDQFAGVMVYDIRANIIDPNNVSTAGSPQIAGGQRLLNASAFGVAASGQGNSGRNEFRGPGLYNVDISLSRSFSLKWIGESGRLTFRADAFNFLNHANLGSPANFLTNPSTFGIASYGRQDQPSAFPAATPLNETARRVQLMLRVQW